MLSNMASVSHKVIISIIVGEYYFELRLLTDGRKYLDMSNYEAVHCVVSFEYRIEHVILNMTSEITIPSCFHIL